MSRKKRGAQSKGKRAQKAEVHAAETKAALDVRAFAISIALSLASGCMWFLACADFDVWPLAWVAMVPVFFAIERAPTRRLALTYGWLAGLVANLGGFYWVASLLSRFAQLPWILSIIGLVVLAAYQALVFWGFAALVRSLRRRWLAARGWPLPMTLLAPIVIVTFELVIPFLFPFYLAITQAWVTPVIQIAELTGPLGVSALLLVASGAVYDAISERRNGWRRFALPPFIGAMVIAAALVFGVVRMAQIDDARAAAPTLKVGLVQANIPFNEKGVDRRELAARQLRGLQTASERLEADGAELIVWSETAHAYPIERDAIADQPEESGRRIRRGFTVPLFFGAVTQRGFGSERRIWNTAILMDEGGRFVGTYDKIFLLLFGEYIPLADTFAWIRRLMPRAASHFEKGETIKTFPFEHAGETYRLGPMICYEDILTDFGRELGASHPHLLVNITNDAWFGETSEPWEHLALSVYRAVEMRTDMVRAVNTGVTAFIDASGRVVQKTHAIDPAVKRPPAARLLGEVALLEGGHGLFIRHGDLFGFACLGAVLGLALLVWRPRRPTV